MKVVEQLERQLELFEEIADRMIRAIREGNKILWCGNGAENAIAQGTRAHAARCMGDANTGGTGSGRVFYRFSLGLPPFVKYLDSYGRVGMTVQILGEGSTADSQVFFNGVAAQMTEVGAHLPKSPGTRWRYQRLDYCNHN